ncbi:MAG: DUF370 domain-containing protein [Niameybacter sp.]
MLIPIGLGNFVALEHIIAVVAPESAPVKRAVKAAKESDTIIDATLGRLTRSVIFMTNNSVVLSSINPQTIIDKVNNPSKKSKKEDQDE